MLQKNKCLRIIKGLLSEIAVQIDMHYEPDEYYKLAPTFDAVVPALEILREHDAEPPEEILTVYNRYLRQRN
jgi:hypothetical protein